MSLCCAASGATASWAAHRHPRPCPPTARRPTPRPSAPPCASPSPSPSRPTTALRHHCATAPAIPTPSASPTTAPRHRAARPAQLVVALHRPAPHTCRARASPPPTDIAPHRRRSPRRPTDCACHTTAVRLPHRCAATSPSPATAARYRGRLVPFALPRSRPTIRFSGRAQRH